MFKNPSHLPITTLLLLVLLAPLSAVRADDKDPKAPSKKEPAKQPNPLQALSDAYQKGVTVTSVEPKDLPKAITDAVAKNAPGATVTKAKKQEIRHTLKYVAFDKPKVQTYQIVVTKDDKRFRVQLGADGGKANVQPLPAEKQEDAPPDPGKEIDIPAKAAKAVKAIKELHPDAVVKEITTEVFQDPSGVVDVLTFEIEFITKGKMREMVASPEGVIPHLWKPVAEKDLPKAVAEAVAKEVPGGKFQSGQRYELRAGLQFGALEEPRVVYKLDLDKEGKASTLAVRGDGSLVPPPVRLGPNRAYLGVSLEKNSAVVAQVAKDGPAEKAGIKAGDKLLALGESKIGGVNDLLKLLTNLKAGAEVRLQIQRGEMMLTIPLKLAALPGS